MSKCKCTVDETTGWTTVKCCNICGKPIEDFWVVPEDELLEVYESILIKMMSEQIPSYNMQEGEAIKNIVAKIEKRRRSEIEDDKMKCLGHDLYTSMESDKLISKEDFEKEWEKNVE